jgi:dihydroflavonol-4-reductase
MRRIALLTGGTGFIGSHLAEEMIRAGWHVRALVRRPDRLRWLRGLDVEIAKGDVEDASSLPSALKEVEVVLHCAGLTKAKNRREYMKANGEGTEALVKASVQAQVRRFVYCSSQAAAGPSTPEQPRTEEDLPKPLTDYGLSKLAGEEAVRACTGQIEWIIVRPPVVFGPRDEQFLSLFRMVKRTKLFPAFGRDERYYSWIYVRDLVLAFRLAAEAEIGVGEIYFAADKTPITWREASEAAASHWKDRARALSLPLIVLRTVALLSEGTALLRGKAALFSRQKLNEIIAPGWVVSSDKIHRVLGFQCTTPLKEAVHETIDWYEKRGWL